jgi:sulfur transfer complex TusBCD TusB component (DsrH family)
MFQFFGKEGKKSGKQSVAQENGTQKTDQEMKAEYLMFREQVVDTKNAVIKAIEKMDKHDAIENLIKLSNLSARAIYNKNLREIVLVDDAIVDIKRDIDQKLASIRNMDNEGKDQEAEYYMLLRLSLIPVCSMLSVINMHTTTAIEEANEEIDSRIQELQHFLVEYETHISKM